MLEQALFDRLSTFAPLQALVGAGNVARIYPNVAAPAPVAPYIVFEIDDDEDQGHAMGVDVAPRRADCRFWCYAQTGDAARGVATQVIAALRRYGGLHSGTTLVDGLIRGNRPTVEDDVKLQGRLVEFQLIYQ